MLNNGEEEDNLIAVEKTETLNFACYGIEAKLQVKKEGLKKVPDSFSLQDGTKLNVIVRERLPLCRRCEVQDHIKKYYPRMMAA